MPLPHEALLPFCIIIGMFAVTGGLLSAAKHYRNEGYSPRYSLDQWDKQMMERDRRLTGSLRKQSDAARYRV
ncbi:hypothetical protein T552_03215 [Pneumocystis carinii B80]|uniref:NADH dehydrogenase [ubiquinone] 1 alpha subcomplex subunit 1 n=1 Tax=Pneumocystis carinii (strain B80) TaxID=1408658 RepID=A0A0W4ZCC7_PNEC8|nr:hypothetical protein T552_03215 [Pneumocystis carinii B80]KTW25941.1 hypothetical protein T552_03215 [Pneumocystis carinii B80]